MKTLLVNYTHFGGGLFFTLHGIVLVFTLALFIQFLRSTKKLSRTVRGMGGLIEAQCRRLMEPLTAFEEYFDACTTAIILIGLVGTMYGFVLAVPKLRTPGYDFSELEQALSASAFGIFWALVVMLLVNSYRWFAVDPIAEDLRNRQTEDVEMEHWRQLAKQTWQQVATKMESSATRFNDAADRIAQAMTQTSADTRDSIVALHAARESSAKTAGDVTAMLNAAMELPEAVRSKLDEIARESAHRLNATTEHFDQSLRRLEMIPATFHDSFQKLFSSQHEDIGKTMAEYRNAIEKIQQVFLESAQQSQAQFSDSLGHTVSQFTEQIKMLRDLPMTFEQAVNKLLETQLSGLRSAQELHHESIRHLQEQSASAFSDARATILDALGKMGELPTQLDEKLGQFADSQRALSQGLAEDQRARMAEIFGHSMIQMGQLEAKTKDFVDAYYLHIKEDHDKLAARLQSVIPELVGPLIKEMRDAARPITDSAAKLDEGFEGLFTDAKRRIQDAVTTSLNTVTKIIEDFRDGLRATQQELPSSVRAAQAEVIAETVNCAHTVSRCADELSKTAKSLPQAIDELRPQIHALNEAARRISNAAADFSGIKGIFDRSFEPLRQQVQQELRSVTVLVPPDIEGEKKTFWQRLRIWPKSRAKAAGGRK